ncbi:MAG TPA: 2,3,4,5-tetrahydropyridine-2,6-dicarboxylate N-succinyltransferase [Mycobacteriales bacterium]|nr:2,3,4,5-tetrahydropyridine-2,6-dicarboxylate N-succinyltransferase [Mycobacteriales bacterium]
MAFSEQPACGRGLATYDGSGRLLEAWFPSPTLGREAAEPPEPLHPVVDEIRAVKVEPIDVAIDSLAAAPRDTADVYLRLQLLSHRLIRPHEANLDGIFGLLVNVAWTSRGPVAAEDADTVRARARAAGERLEVYGVDKFPRMTDYVVPSGVRIADADRVRLGAYLAPGTTVMHEGFVNFNAGTLGTSMVEGRISAGVVVGDGTDVGGGASIMGTLSGGGNVVVSLGERCLLGANSGIGIPLGDECVVAAGCYVTAGSKLTLPDGSVVAARELAGISNMQFWQNSVTGALEARPRSGTWGGLNAALHAQ